MPHPAEQFKYYSGCDTVSEGQLYRTRPQERALNARGLVSDMGLQQFVMLLCVAGNNVR